MSEDHMASREHAHTHNAASVASDLIGQEGMSIITRIGVTMDVPRRFREAYKHYDRDYRFPSEAGNFGTVGELDAALHAARTAEEIRAILPTWCKLECDSCGRDVDRLIRIGDAPDYEARWQDLCADCLAHALAILTNQPAHAGDAAQVERESSRDEPNPSPAKDPTNV